MCVSVLHSRGVAKGWRFSWCGGGSTRCGSNRVWLVKVVAERSTFLSEGLRISAPPSNKKENLCDWGAETPKRTFSELHFRAPNCSTHHSGDKQTSFRAIATLSALPIDRIHTYLTGRKTGEHRWLKTLHTQRLGETANHRSVHVQKGGVLYSAEARSIAAMRLEMPVWLARN